MTPWPDGTPGLLLLPSGRRARGRRVRDVPGGPPATLGVYGLGAAPDPMPWETLWIRWPDFRVPTDPDRAVAVLRSAYDRLTSERVEAACDGGIGRTGTILAAWCVIDGLTPDAAVAHVRAGYHPRAVETPWQRRFLWRLAP